MGADFARKTKDCVKSLLAVGCMAIESRTFCIPETDFEARLCSPWFDILRLKDVFALAGLWHWPRHLTRMKSRIQTSGLSRGWWIVAGLILGSLLWWQIIRGLFGLIDV
ncbi:hypothetical protein [Primorskyibacter sp. 2E233]|uniref:hypothetical protein n=1 Tax=Primorskyibacter sp. 2E233 TaxID=3413431 RepID=UPI003BF40938